MKPRSPSSTRPLASLVFVASVTLVGCKGNGDAGPSTTSGRKDGRIVGAAASVNVVADEKGFSPSSFELEKGAPATLIFRRTSDATCATQVVFPELKLTKDLPLNVPVPIEVPTGDARTLTFQCGMGMFKGRAIIH